MPDLAELGIVVKSDQALKGAINLDRLATSGNKAEKSVKGVGNVASDTERKVQKLITPLRLVGGLLAGIGVSVSLSSAIKEFIIFEKALIGVGKTTNILGEDLDALGEEILALTSILPNSAEELAGIAQAAGQLGVSGSDNIIKFTDTVARLGSATNLSGEEAATTLARMLTITGEAIGSVDVLGSVIVRLGNNFAATEAEIASAATRVAQATSLFGLSSAEVSAIGTALTAVGVQAEAGGTVIGKSFQLINKAVNEGGDELKTLTEITGLTGKALKDLFDSDPAAAFEEMITAFGQLEKSELPGVLAKLGLTGERSFQVIGTLATRADVLSDALRQANDEVENTTALMTESETAMKSLDSQMQLVGNEATKLAIAIGAMFAPTAASSAKFVASALQDLTENIDDLVTVVELAAIAVGGRLTAALILKSAALLKSVISAKAAAAANLEQANATLFAAQNEIRMATAMEAGVARRNALSAAAGRVAIAHKAVSAATLEASIAARTAAASMTALRSAMAFFGGPLGLAITAVAAGMLLFSKNTEAAKKTTRELSSEINNLTSGIEKLNRAQLEGAAIKVEDSLAELKEKQRLAKANLETLNQNARFVKDLNKHIRDTKIARAELADVTKSVTDAEESLKKINDKLSSSFSSATNEIKDTNDAAGDLGNTLSDAEKDIADLINSLRAENSQLGRMVAATAESKQAVADLNVEIEIENTLREKSIELKSKEGQEIAALIRSNAELEQSVRDNAEANEQASNASTQAAAKQAANAQAAADIMTEPFKNAIREIQSAFSTGFREMLDGEVNTFRDFANVLLDIFKQMLAEMAAAAATRQIAIPILNSVAGSFGFSGAASAAGAGSGGSALGGFLAGALPGGSTGMAATWGKALGAGFISYLATNYVSEQLGQNTNRGGNYGAIAGTVIGAPWGPLGSAIGAAIGTVVGNTLGNIFGAGSNTTQRLGFNTGVQQEGIDSPFGTIGLTRQRGIDGIAVLNTLASMDEGIASLLNESQIARVRSELAGTSQRFDVNQFDNESFDVVKTRLIRIIDAVAENSTASKLLDSIARDPGNIDALVTGATEIINMIQMFDENNEVLNSAEQALQALNDEFDNLEKIAGSLGFAFDRAGKEAEAVGKLTTDFNASIEDQILAIVDPIQLALREQDKLEKERIDNAITLGADLVQIEKLNALERQQILDRFSSGGTSAIQNFLTDITSGSNSPLSTQQVLANADKRFTELFALAQAGDAQAKLDVVGAASNLLDASRNMFGSSPEFFNRFDDIRSSLESLVASDSVVTNLQAIGESIVRGDADIVEQLQTLNDKIEDQNEIIVDQQAALDRLVTA